MTSSGTWTQQGALFFCRVIERLAPDFGCHIGLTGGCLYKDGSRKDLDVIVYRIRQTDRIDIEGLFAALSSIGVERGQQYGWVIKATWHTLNIDFFFPERQGEEFDHFDNAAANPAYGGVA